MALSHGLYTRSTFDNRNELSGIVPKIIVVKITAQTIKSLKVNTRKMQRKAWRLHFTT